MYVRNVDWINNVYAMNCIKINEYSRVMFYELPANTNSCVIVWPVCICTVEVHAYIHTYVCTYIEQYHSSSGQAFGTVNVKKKSPCSFAQFWQYVSLMPESRKKRCW